MFEGQQANLYVYVENDPVNWIDIDVLSKFDKWYGLPKKFRNWFHRNVKEEWDPDRNREELLELFEEWKDLGKPGPDKKGPKGPKGGGFGPEDLFDWLFPFPFFVDPCAINPEFCQVPEC